MAAPVLVGAFAAVLRLIWVAVASREPLGVSDPLIYLHSGSSIAAGDGYTSLLGNPTAYYPPGYPFFVGAVERVATAFGLADHRVLVIGLVQALLGGVACGALVVAGRQLAPSGATWRGGRDLGTAIGVGAGLLLALWPNLVLHTAVVLSETLFLACLCTLLAALFTWTAARTSNPASTDPTSTAPASTDPASTDPIGPTRLSAVLVVVSTALCVWIRPQSTLVLVPAVALAWLVAGRGLRDSLRVGGLLVVGVLVAVLPWTVRNLVVMDAFVPLSTNTGDNLCIGFHDGAKGGFAFPEACGTGQRYVDGVDVEVERDAELRGRALDWIVEHPGSLPGLTWGKLRATFDGDHDGLRAWESYGQDPHLSDGLRTGLRWLSDVYYWVVSLAAIAGAALVVRDRWSGRRGVADRSTLVGLSTVAIALGCIAVPALSFGDQRFKIPITAALALLAASAVARATRAPGAADDESHDAPGEVDAAAPSTVSTLDPGAVS